LSVIKKIVIVEKRDTDYHVRLTSQEIDFLSSPVIKRMEGLVRVKPQLSAPVLGSFPHESLNFACTQDSTVLKNEKTNGGVYFDRDENGPIVRTHPFPLRELTYERDYIETRYDGHKARILIRRDDDQAQQLDLGMPGVQVFPHQVHEAARLFQEA
jgi:hypothetical protein